MATYPKTTPLETLALVDGLQKIGRKSHLGK